MWGTVASWRGGSISRQVTTAGSWYEARGRQFINPGSLSFAEARGQQPARHDLAGRRIQIRSLLEARIRITPYDQHISTPFPAILGQAQKPSFPFLRSRRLYGITKARGLTSPPPPSKHKAFDVSRQVQKRLEALAPFLPSLFRVLGGGILGARSSLRRIGR